MESSDSVPDQETDDDSTKTDVSTSTAKVPSYCVKGALGGRYGLGE
jgi:hypothetical protein